MRAAVFHPPYRSATNRMVLQILVDEGDRHAAFADGGRDPLDRAEAHVAAGKYAGHTGLDEVGVAAFVPQAGFQKIGSGEDIAAGVAGNLRRKPVGFGIGADEDEQSAAFLAPHGSGFAVVQVRSP